MTKPMSGTANVGLFLAHALALENAAAHRYAELSQSTAAADNPEVASLFGDLGYFARKHAADVRALADAHGGVPQLAAWEFVWYSNEPPENVPADVTEFKMTPRQALQMAQQCEERAYQYYANIAVDTNDPEVARLANEFADEETEHVRLVTLWLERFPAMPGARASGVTGRGTANVAAKVD
ncbi:MAG: rubrerythrin [Azospirillum sp.]|nr:rubrerythrin [Azospirillum sp.]